MFDIIVADSATNVKPIININNSLKKYIVIFFTIYPLHIETLKVLEKLIKKWHKYVEFNTFYLSNLCEMILPYGIPSQKNQAKEGLTLCLKLDHFPILH